MNEFEKRLLDGVTTVVHEIRSLRTAIETRWSIDRETKAALERIAASVAVPPKARRAAPKTGTAAMLESDAQRSSGRTQAVISAYCDAFKRRYGAHPPIDGAAASAAKRILSAMTAERAGLLVQAYLQMDDPWFLKRTHDLPTLASNLAKVAVSLANGTQDPHERAFWQRVFGDEGGADDQGQLPATNPATAEDVGGTLLPRGAG